MNKYNILVVDDDLDIIELITLYLQNCGYSVTTANSYDDALEKIRIKSFHLIILDIMLPDFNGTNLCQEIRKFIYCPIIFVSCIDDENQILNALNIGGDDYIKKPFNPKELVARVKSNLRRVQYDRQLSENRKLKIKDLVIDLDKNIVIKQNVEITLSPMEFDILSFMVNKPNKVLSYTEIYKNIWGNDSLGDVRTVMVHVSNLRKKIEKNSSMKYIKTITRKGYVFLD